MSILFDRYKKEIFILLILIISVISTSAFITHKQLSDSSKQTYFNKLSVLKYSLSAHIKDYFKENKQNILSLASNETTLKAFKSLNTAFDLVQSEYKKDINNDILLKELEDYKSKIRFNVPHASPRRETKKYLSGNKTTEILQYLYLATNPFGTRNKNKLYASKANISYDRAHKVYHSYFLNELKIYDFYDILLMNLDGEIIYTSYKEHDFGTNIRDGVYANSSLSVAYKKALSAHKQDVIFEDFTPYEPSYNKPIAFMATPLYSDGVKIGVIAIQFSNNQINKIMTLNNSHEKIGLKKSGEAYLVGSDYLMRSDSRFKNTIKNPLVEQFSTTVGIIQVDSPQVKRALAGETSHGAGKDYRNIEVFTSYAPINILGKKWAILVELDKDEATYSIENSIATILFSSIVLTILFLMLLGYVFLRLILRPMEKTEELLAEDVLLKEKKLESSQTILNEYKKAVDISSIVSKTTPNGIITFVNDSFCEISGYTREELIGKLHNIVRHPDMPRETYKELWDTLLQKRVWKGVIKNLKKDGGEYYVSSTIVPILDENSEIREFISIRSDITELTRQEKQIHNQTTDKTTSLPNKQKLLEDISEAKDAQLKLAIIQINRFKEVNDFYGIEIGDLLLINITSILKTIVNEDYATLYKINGDEFAILESKEMSMQEFSKKITNIIRYFDHNIVTLSDDSFNISVTAGLSAGYNSKIFFNTEMSLRRSTENSPSLMAFENADDIEKQYLENISMTTKIKNAIKNDNIIIFTQPIKSNYIDGKSKFECLVRMRDGDKLISPFFFLEIAKKARLYSTITKIVIEKAFHHFKDSNSEFSINLTIEDILNDEIVSFLKRKIKDYRIGHRVVIELVESEGIENFEHIDKFIKDVKGLGCQIAIDDFGTGYSNFEYLMKLNADYIKIDGSLIKNINTDESSQIVVELIVGFAKRMKIKTIAEFVHNEQVYQKIKSLGIDYSQGYYLGEPTELK